MKLELMMRPMILNVLQNRSDVPAINRLNWRKRKKMGKKISLDWLKAFEMLDSNAKILKYH